MPTLLSRSLASLARPLRMLVAYMGMLLVPAAVMYAHGALHERVEELTAQLSAEPDNAAVRFELAAVYTQHEDWYLALAALERVEQLAPGQFATDLVRAQASLGAGRLDIARAALERHVATHGEHFAESVVRARLAARQGALDEAVQAYTRVMATATQGTPSLVQEFSTLLSALHRPEGSARVLAAGIMHFGPVPDLLLAGVAVETELRHFDTAATYLTALQQGAPRPEPWIARRADLLAQAGRPAEARAAWQELQASLQRLPNLDRGTPELLALAQRAALALATPDASLAR